MASALEERGAWTARLDALRTDWQRIEPIRERTTPSEWLSHLAAMRADMERLQRSGKWASGPHDLVSIIGLNRWELAHSAALAWLCTPHAAHGLGSTFLEGLIAYTGEPVSMAAPVVARTEVSRAESRADVIVEGAGWALVIEVKVDALEQPRQAERLFNDWHDDADVRFIFLTRGTKPPQSAGAVAGAAWTPISWRQTRSLLRTLTEQAEETATARPALLEYLHTLDNTF